jgi:hypothetical protein
MLAISLPELRGGVAKVHANFMKINVMIKETNIGEELIRISNENSEKIEYSTDNGKNWHVRYMKGACRDCENLPHEDSQHDYNEIICKQINGEADSRKSGGKI